MTKKQPSLVGSLLIPEFFLDIDLKPYIYPPTKYRMKFLLPSLLLLGSANALAPRNIKIQGQNFVDVNGNNVVMSGPNVVVKGKF